MWACMKKDLIIAIFVPTTGREGALLTELPRKRHRRWGPSLQLIEDRSARLIPYRLDQFWCATPCDGACPPKRWNGACTAMV